MKLNRAEYLDKVKACWTGKNIGGTMGAPYERKTEMQDIQGFITKKGEPMPNDDLDLQLCWLCAVEDRGIKNITPQLLGEYWIDYIPPYWNEYGIGKANLAMGMLPPYSGEYKNEKWSDSNGAFIRTEIWACLFPSLPELAVRYAYIDACVDHGLGEGTYSAMFVAAMESAAFVEKDVRKLIDIGLSYIPEDCKLAKTVKLAIELYDNHTDFAVARNKVVEFNADLGWFQSPANVSFVILGLLYGEGDFKKSMIYAIDCGDDTDCTGATIGSIMGIVGGTKAIPEDWAEYIGNRIITCSLNMDSAFWPKTLEELTERVYELVPSCLKAYSIYMEYTDGENEYQKYKININRTPEFDIPTTGYSMNLPDLIYAKGRVEFDKCYAVENDVVQLKFVLKNCFHDPKTVQIRLFLPEGWTANKEEISLRLDQSPEWNTTEESVIITVGKVSAVNTIYAKITCLGRPTTYIFPICIGS